MVDVIEKLKSLSYKANSHVNNINLGGCAVMAALVGKELEKLGIEVEGIVPDGVPAKVRVKSKKPHKHDANWWDAYGVDFEHVALRFKFEGKTYTYDTDFLFKNKKKFGNGYRVGFKFGEGFNIKELKKIASTKGDYWNITFNRRDIPKLRKIVREVFSND